MDIQYAFEAFTSKHPDDPIRWTEDDSGITISLSGSLDMQYANDLQDPLTSIVEHLADGRRLAVDMANVNYLSSTGVGVLTFIMTKARRRGLTFRLRGLRPKIRSMFSMLGFTSFLNEAEENT